MTRALYIPSVEAAEWDEVPTPAAYLEQMVAEVEQALAPRQEPPQRATPAPAQTPHPFTHD